MFAIIRAHKHKTLGSVSRSAAHTFRELPTPNAAPDLTPKNILLKGKSSKEIMGLIHDRLPAKRRKDSVVCIEYLITASPEAFRRHGGQLDDHGSGYFKDALSWLSDRHGSDNIISAAVHLDETTPHLVAYITPITSDGRLSARDFLGGPQKMRDMQDSFYEACGKSRGLLRGIQGSKAKHSEVSQFYSQLVKEGAAPKLRAADYAAKAAGYETTCWKEAMEVHAFNEKRVEIASLNRKAIISREKASQDGNNKMRLATADLERRRQALEKGEQTLQDMRRELSHRKYDFELAAAKVESAERLLALHQKNADEELKYSRIRALNLAPRPR
ncbi:MobV family relaxase [Halopseudomonas sp.]|uniref:MobV family relaxase n=1 Tax=Halopseudomonas sp. TaxID=2901191 RepID=UPI0030010E9E